MTKKKPFKKTGVPWLDKICKILLNPKHKQVYGTLIAFDSDSITFKNGKTKTTIIGKCALGEIGCQVGITPEALYNKIPYQQILEACDVPRELRTVPFILPRMYATKCDTNLQLEITQVEIESNGLYRGDDLSDYIFQLNDVKFTYPQIVSFLRTTFGDWDK